MKSFHKLVSSARNWKRLPNQYNPNLFPVGSGFGLLVYFDRYEDTHFRNGVQKKPTSKPRGQRKKKQTF